MIRKVIIRNYRKFRKLDVSMLPGVNVLVGSNDSGKSTLIEAINLALTGRVNLPIDDGIDVISVGLSHKRFLDLAIRLKRRVWVVTDNDGKTTEEVNKRFAEYTGYDFVSVHTGSDPDLRTLEPQIVAANELATLNAALGKAYTSKEEAAEAMIADKTGAALAIFESAIKIKMPDYLANVVDSH